MIKDLIFITSNAKKAHYLKQWLGIDIPHQSLELEELQSLDPEKVVEHKARQAYAIMKRPVLVEDVSLRFTAMGRLPGTYIKWFLEEIGLEGLCRIADTLDHREAVAQVTYGICDGTNVYCVSGQRLGTIAQTPQKFVEGNSWRTGKSWGAVFIPEGNTKTYAEMDDEELKTCDHRHKAIEALQIFLQQHK